MKLEYQNIKIKFPSLAICLLLVFLVTDGGDVSAASSPSISRIPKSVITVGQKYWFRPKVRGLKKSKLRFSISGKPAWATFRTADGALRGVPRESHVGIYDKIVIRVTDGKISAALEPFSITVKPGKTNADPQQNTENKAPTISGQAPSSVQQGFPYRFAPVAKDADEDLLTFSIDRMPGWATFSPGTGLLQGMPQAPDVGVYDNIVITVSDGKNYQSLGPFRIIVSATGDGSVTLQWTPPTMNTDGSPLIGLAAYRIDWGLSTGALTNTVRINNPGLSSYLIDNLAPNEYKFVIFAISNAGIESDSSNEVIRSIQ